MKWWDIPLEAQAKETDFTLLSPPHWQLACHILIALSFFSFVLGAFVFFSYLLFKHKFPSRLITYFSLSTSLNGCTFLVLSWTEGNVLISTTGCITQGIINQFFASSVIIWWFCITINLYATFVKNRKIAHYEVYMHIICWGGALLMTIFPAMADQMKPVGLWCWVSEFWWQVGAYYFIMGICCLLGGLMWISIIVSITSLTQRYKFSDRSAVSVHVIRQSLFIIWFLIIFCFMFFHRFYFHIHGGIPYWLLLVHLTAMSSQGIFVFLIFGLRSEIFHFWQSLLYKKCFSKCSERDSYHSLG